MSHYHLRYLRNLSNLSKGEWTMKKWRDLPQPQGLYDPRNEHDACGIGFVAHIKGKRSYSIVDDALKILENLKHRGGEGADQKSGDGAGILTQIPLEP